MKKSELKLLCDAKEHILSKCTFTYIGNNLYSIHITPKHWHDAFKTDECKKEGLIKSHKHP